MLAAQAQDSSSNFSECYKYDLSTSQNLQFWLRGWLPLIISVIGIVLNTTTIYIIAREPPAPFQADPREPSKHTFKLLLVNLFKTIKRN